MAPSHARVIATIHARRPAPLPHLRPPSPTPAREHRSSNLIFGIDYTKSNTWTGEKTFGGKCLHSIDPTGRTMNPYQQVIDVAARTLEPFDDDHLIPCYGFGDMTTTDKGVFPFFPNEAPCNGVAGVLQRYNEVTPAVQMLGPTSFAVFGVSFPFSLPPSPCLLCSLLVHSTPTSPTLPHLFPTFPISFPISPISLQCLPHLLRVSVFLLRFALPVMFLCEFFLGCCCNREKTPHNSLWMRSARVCHTLTRMCSRSSTRRCPSSSRPGSTTS